ncbi:MAG: hypothetical protein ACYC7A_09150 [Thermoanaerobaculia bacterium]
MRKGNVTALILAGALFIVLAAGLGVQRVAAAEGAEGEAAAPVPNLAAIHDPDSDEYESDCLSCHRHVLTEATADPRLLPFHKAMIPYVPGFNARKGVESKHCTTCHRDAVDFAQESGSSLRRNVSVASCIYCHSSNGPGPVYYQ